MHPLLKAAIFLGLLFAALPAYALDCKSAAVTGDAMSSAICANPELKQADDDMNNAYQTLFRGRDKAQQDILKRLQVDWIARGRIAYCDTNPVEVPCVLINTTKRTAELKAFDGAGAVKQGKLVFKGLYIPRKTKADTVFETSLYQFETPDTDGKKSFNAEVEKILAGQKDDAGLTASQTQQAADAKSDDTDEIDCSNCEHDTTMAAPYQAANFISVAVDFWANDGGAHGNYYTHYINQFLDMAHPLAFDDLFIDYDASVLAKLCYDQMIGPGDGGGATTGDSDETYRPSNDFMQTFRDPGNWSFDGKNLEVNFGYQFGSYGSGDQTCDIAYEDLKPHLTAGAKLPGL